VRTKAATWLAHDEDLAPFGSVVSAIHQTSLFTFGNYEEMHAAFAGQSNHYIYSRGRNPTVAAFEEKVAELARAEAARAFSSGMGAISAAVLANVKAGDRIICVRNVYPDAYKLMTQFLPRFGVEVVFLDGTSTAEVSKALPGAKVLYLENPTSLVFTLQDVAALTAAARAHDVTTILDNSWATPLYQHPIDLGVNLVVHSASKYLSGHSDVVAGIVLGRQKDIEQITSSELALLGAKLSPFEGWLLLRGLRTLQVRLDRHHQSALKVAQFLREHPAVACVHFPELPDHPQHDLYRRQFGGSSGLLSFEVREEYAAKVPCFVDALRLFHLGVSWGGYESLVYPAAIGHAAPGATNAVRDFAVPKTLIRLHVGLEDPEDLTADLAQGFAVLEGGGS
jgi:cystathionine beta-lyase